MRSERTGNRILSISTETRKRERRGEKGRTLQVSEQVRDTDASWYALSPLERQEEASSQWYGIDLETEAAERSPGGSIFESVRKKSTKRIFLTEDPRSLSMW